LHPVEGATAVPANYASAISPAAPLARQSKRADPLAKQGLQKRDILRQRVAEDKLASRFRRKYNAWR
jgi:hypothetical protein